MTKHHAKRLELFQRNGRLGRLSLSRVATSCTTSQYASMYSEKGDTRQFVKVLGASAVFFFAFPLFAQPASTLSVLPGDRLVVRFYDIPSSGVPPLQTALIDERGDADIPMVGLIHLAGLSAIAAQDSVRARMKAFLRPGASAVTLERRIAVLGQVKKPDTYYVDLTVNLREAIARAGGVDELGVADRVQLVRAGTTTEIEHWLTSPAGSQDLRSGDQIIVPRESWIRRNALSSLSMFVALASVLVSVFRK